MGVANRPPPPRFVPADNNNVFHGNGGRIEEVDEEREENNLRGSARLRQRLRSRLRRNRQGEVEEGEGLRVNQSKACVIS